MSFLERRHLERLTPEALLYVDLKPDNGGIVVNVSDGGFCFQSVAPVQTHQSLSFSIRDHDLQTDGVGEVVWTDQTRKFGGLRFTHVKAEKESARKLNVTPAESGDPIADWEAIEEEYAPPIASHEPKNGHTATLLPLKVERATPLHTALLREVNPFPIGQSQKKWLPRLLIAALAIYAIVATVALYRYMRPHSSEAQKATVPPSPQVLDPQQAVPNAPEVATASMPSAPVPQVPDPQPAAPSAAKASPAPIAKPAAGLVPAPVQDSVVIHKAVASVTEPERPLIQTSPFSFDYPTAPGGIASGTVHLRVLIDAAGAVEAVRVLSGNGSLASSAVRAARGWRYRPLQVDGRPVKSEAHVKVRFSGGDAVSVAFRE